MKKKPKKPKKPGYRLAFGALLLLGGCAGAEKAGDWLNERVGPESRPRYEAIDQAIQVTAQAAKPALNPKQQGYVDLATPIVGLVLAGLAGVLGSKKEQA